MELLIVRHAKPRTEVLPEGQPADPGLSEIGRQQAELTADFLAGERIDHIVSSTMRRAHETALPLAERLSMDVECLDDLRESDHASNIYVPTEDFTPDNPITAHFWRDEGGREISDWSQVLKNTVFSDGYEAFEERVLRGFQHVIGTNKSRSVAVFCHGMVTLMYLSHLIGSSNPLSLQVDYCGINRVLAASNGLRTVRSVNETHHVRHLL